MNKNIITLACAALLMAGTCNIASAQTPESIELATNLDSQLRKGMSQDQVRGLLGTPSDVSFGSTHISWRYAYHDGARGYTYKEYKAISRGQSESGSSSSSTRKTTTTKKKGFGGFGRALGNAMGGDAGRIVRDVSRMGDSSTTTTTTDTETNRQSSTEVKRPYVSVNLTFDKSTGLVRNYGVSPK